MCGFFSKRFLRSGYVCKAPFGGETVKLLIIIMPPLNTLSWLSFRRNSIKLYVVWRNLYFINIQFSAFSYVRFRSGISFVCMMNVLLMLDLYRKALRFPFGSYTWYYIFAAGISLIYANWRTDMGCLLGKLPFKHFISISKFKEN